MLGVSYDGWTTIMGALEAAPRAQGDLAAGLAGRHVARRRLPPQWRVPSQLRLRVRRHDGERPRRRSSSTSIAMTPTTGTSRSAAGECQHECTCTAQIPTWNDYVAHPDYDAFWQRQTLIPHIAAVNVPTLNVAGWWDQEDFYGPVAHLRGARDNRHARHQLSGRRPVEPRRLVAGHGREALGPLAFRQQHRRVFPPRHPGALVRALAQGQGQARTCPKP